MTRRSCAARGSNAGVIPNSAPTVDCLVREGVFDQSNRNRETFGLRLPQRYLLDSLLGRSIVNSWLS